MTSLSLQISLGSHALNPMIKGGSQSLPSQEFTESLCNKLNLLSPSLPKSLP